METVYFRLISICKIRYIRWLENSYRILSNFFPFFCRWLGTVRGASGARTSMAEFRKNLVITSRWFYPCDEMWSSRSGHRKAKNSFNHFWRGTSRRWRGRWKGIRLIKFIWHWISIFIMLKYLNFKYLKHLKYKELYSMFSI